MVFGIPLADGSFGIIQAIDIMLVNVIYIAVFSDRYEYLPSNIISLKNDNLISLQATWKQDLNNGSWANICTIEPAVKKVDFPNEKFSESGYVGAKHASGGMFNRFLNAYHGIEPWNVMADERYWDTYLNVGKSRPEEAFCLNDEERNKYRSEILGVKNS